MKKLQTPLLLFLSSLLFFSCSQSSFDLSTFFTKKFVDDVLMDELSLRKEPPVDIRLSDSLSMPLSGLNKWFEHDSVVNIVFVPGMRTKDWHNYNYMLAYLSDSLDLRMESFRQIRTFTGREDALLDSGELTLVRFVSKDPAIPRRLYCYIANWTTITDPAKQALFEFDKINQYEKAKDNNGENPLIDRTFLTQKLKNDYLVDIFGDLALYRQEDYAQAIQHTVQAAVYQIKEEENLDRPTLFVTGSHGSEITIDALTSLLSFEENSFLSDTLEQIMVKVRNLPPQDQPDSIDAYIANFIYSIDSTWGENRGLSAVYIEEELKDLQRRLVPVFQKFPEDFSIAHSCIRQWCLAYDELKLWQDTLNVRQIFMLNNQLLFTSLLNYSTEDMANTQIDRKVKNKILALGNLDLLQHTDAVESELQIISFYDPNDLLGFQITNQLLETDSQTNRVVRLYNIPLSHSIVWSIDAQTLKTEYLYRLPVGDIKDQIIAEIGDHDRITIYTSLEWPSEGAKNNLDVFHYILDGEPVTRRFFVPQEEASVPNESGYDNFIEDGVSWEEEPNGKILSGDIAFLGGVYFLSRINSLFRIKDLPYTVPPEEVNLPGIGESIRTNDTTFVLTVHGMGSKQTDHFDPMAFQLAKKLGFVLHDVSNPVADSVTTGGLPYGIRILKFKNGDGKFLLFYIVHWSPMTRSIKEELRDLNRQAAQRADNSLKKRSPINRLLKEKIIIDGFVDVNLLLGERDFLGQMAQSVITGMKLLDCDNHGTKQNIFLISGSLGSRVLYDQITYTLSNKMKADPADILVTQKILQKTLTWYMLTNQLAMISLRDIDSSRRAEDFGQQVWKPWEQLFEDENLHSLNLNIVAFHDPNDVLTFQLPPLDSQKAPGCTLYNMPLRTGDGIEIKTYRTYKMVKEIEQNVEKQIRCQYKEERKVHRKTIYKAEKKQYKQDKKRYKRDRANVEFPVKPQKLPRRTTDPELVRLNCEINMLKEYLTVQPDQLNASKSYILVKSHLDSLEYEVTKRKKQLDAPYFAPSLLKFYDLESNTDIATHTKKASGFWQSYMFRFDLAHEGVSVNQRVLNVIALGTPSYREQGVRK